MLNCDRDSTSTFHRTLNSSSSMYLQSVCTLKHRLKCSRFRDTASDSPFSLKNHTQNAQHHDCSFDKLQFTRIWSASFSVAIGQVETALNCIVLPLILLYSTKSPPGRQLPSSHTVFSILKFQNIINTPQN